MNAWRATAAVLLVVGLATRAGGREQAADNKSKIVGVWSVPEDPNLKAAGTIEFTRDMKLKVALSVKVTDKTESVNFDGTYAVDGDKLTVTVKMDGNSKTEKLTIKRLDDKELVTVDEKGKEETFKRKK